MLYLESDIFNNFESTFTNVMQAMCDSDFDYLNNIMEKRLFEKTK
jgi:hypothetical protein